MIVLLPNCSSSPYFLSSPSVSLPLKTISEFSLSFGTYLRHCLIKYKSQVRIVPPFAMMTPSGRVLLLTWSTTQDLQDIQKREVDLFLIPIGRLVKSKDSLMGIIFPLLTYFSKTHQRYYFFSPVYIRSITQSTALHPLVLIFFWRWRFIDYFTALPFLTPQSLLN